MFWLTKDEKELVHFLLNTKSLLRIHHPQKINLIPYSFWFGIIDMKGKDPFALLPIPNFENMELSYKILSRAYNAFSGLLKKQYLFLDPTFEEEKSIQYHLSYKAYQLKRKEIPFPFWELMEWEELFKTTPIATFLTNSNEKLRQYVKLRLSRNIIKKFLNWLTNVNKK